MTLLGAQTAVWESHRRESGKGCPWVRRPGQGQALPQHPWVALGQSLDCRGPYLRIAVEDSASCRFPAWHNSDVRRMLCG